MRIGRPTTARVLLAALLAWPLAVAPAAALPSGTTTDRLPDLRMATPRSFYIQTYGGQRRLRFTTFIRNGGQGPFEIQGRRQPGDELMNVRQRIFDTAGDWRWLETPARMRFARSEEQSDGHYHWHTQRVATYQLFVRQDPYWVPVDGRSGRKTGFCFFDTDPYDLSLPGAPRSRHYVESTCGTTSSLTARMGLSVGWSDEYPASFAWQWIDVAGLDPDRRYRVCVTVDEFGWFPETVETNNNAWAEVRWNSTGSSVRFVSSGTTTFGRIGSRCGNGSVASVVADSNLEAIETAAGGGAADLHAHH